MTRSRAASAVLAVLLATSAAACRPRTPAEAPPASPEASAPPALSSGGPPERQEDGRIAYPVVVRSDSGVVFVPLSLSATRGEGSTAWVRRTPATWAFDAAEDRYLRRPSEAGGSEQDEYVDVIFPASPQRLTVNVRYEGAPPAEEELVLAYRTVAIGDLARTAYVLPTLPLGDAAEEGGGSVRAPLGDPIGSVQVARWLAAGFLLREAGASREVRLRVAGPRPQEHDGPEDVP